MHKIDAGHLVLLLQSRIDEATRMRKDRELGSEANALWGWREDALREVLTMIQSGAYDVD